MDHGMRFSSSSTFFGEVGFLRVPLNGDVGTKIADNSNGGPAAVARNPANGLSKSDACSPLWQSADCDRDETDSRWGHYLTLPAWGNFQTVPPRCPVLRAMFGSSCCMSGIWRIMSACAIR